MRLTSTVFVLAGVLVASRARADGPLDHEKAVALFEEARKAIDDGHCDVAIPKLEQSLKYEPSIGARLSFADCTESSDPLEAWTQLREAQRLAYLKHDDRINVARDRAAALEPGLPLVHVVVPATVLQEPGLELRIDGSLVDRFFYAEGLIALKAGAHVIDASTPARRWSQQVVATKGATTLVTVHLEAQAVASAPPPPPQAPVAVSRDVGGAQRAVALIVGGIGLGVMGAGAILGGAALVKKGDIDAACGGDARVCNVPSGTLDSQRADQQTYTHLSTVTLIVGAVAVASGVVLYLTAPRAQASVGVTTGVGPTGASLLFVGRF